MTQQTLCTRDPIKINQSDQKYMNTPLAPNGSSMQI